MEKIKSKFILEKIFTNLSEKRRAKIALYNKKLTRRIGYTTNYFILFLSEEDFEKQCLKTKYLHILNYLKYYLIKYSIKK